MPAQLLSLSLSWPMRPIVALLLVVTFSKRVMIQITLLSTSVYISPASIISRCMEHLSAKLHSVHNTLLRHRNIISTNTVVKMRIHSLLLAAILSTFAVAEPTTHDIYSLLQNMTAQVNTLLTRIDMLDHISYRDVWGISGCPRE